jgi:hypothetical protein
MRDQQKKLGRKKPCTLKEHKNLPPQVGHEFNLRFIIMKTENGVFPISALVDVGSQGSN